MRDFKYSSLVSQPLPWRNAVVRTRALEKCQRAFLGNLMRTAILAMLPTEIAFQLSRNVVFTANSVFKATGEVKSPMELFNTELTPDMQREFDKQVLEDIATPKEEADKQRWTMGIQYTEGMLEHNVCMRGSMDAILASIVLESWTAFETLAGDAWVILVNKGPASIANKVNESKKSREEENYQTPFDVRKNLGEYLRDVRAYSFQKVYGIKTAYSVALGKTKGHEIFGTDEGRIVLLSAVRNALTHSGGKIDKHFIDQAAMFPEFANAEIGSRLVLDGEFVVKLRAASALTGIAILNAIDDVLSPVAENPS